MDLITGVEGKDYSIGLGKMATYVATRNPAGQVERRFLDVGEAATPGAIVYYRLPEDLVDGAPASLAFLDAEGRRIREFCPRPAGYERRSDEDRALDPGPWMPVRAGVNRFVWDLRYPGATRLRGNKTGKEADRGPLVLPGTYQVRLCAGGGDAAPGLRGRERSPLPRESCGAPRAARVPARHTRQDLGRLRRSPAHPGDR